MDTQSQTQIGIGSNQNRFAIWPAQVFVNYLFLAILNGWMKGTFPMDKYVDLLQSLIEKL